MKILQVVPYFPPAYAFGGPVSGAYHISKELVNRGHEVIVYTTDARDFSSRLNVPFVRNLNGMCVYVFKNLSMLFVKHSNLFLTLDLIPNAKNMLNSFDIIHMHDYRTFQNIVIFHFARRYNIPYVLQANGSLVYLGRNKRKRFFDILWGYKLLRGASKLIALTSFEAEQYKCFGLPYQKIAIIPSVFDFSEYTVLPHKGSFKVKYNIRYKKIILYLGRIHWIKGLDILVEAFAILLKKMKLKDILLVIVGPDDGYLLQLIQIIKHYGIENEVLLPGPLYGTEKLEVLVDTDIFVLPSRYEAFSRSLREAYAFGKPVIASNVGGLKEMVMDRVTGILFDPGNAEQLANSLRYLLNDDDRAEKMGLKGKQFVKENFTIEKTLDQLEELYIGIFE